jgi:hypothetical protein
MPLTVPHQKEVLCSAHIHATAGMARMNLSAKPVFDYGVDGEFIEIIELTNGKLRDSPFKLAYQAKDPASRRRQRPGRA